MAGGMHHLARAIEHIQAMIEGLFTEDLQRSLLEALRTVEGLDVEQLNDLIGRITDIFNDESISAINDLIQRVRAAINEVDPTLLQNILSNVDSILEQASNPEIINNIITALETLSTTGASIQELLVTAQQLILPAKFALYGVFGWAVATAIMQAVNVFLLARNDQTLRNILAVSQQQLFVSIGQLRQASAQTDMLAEILHLAQQNSDEVEAGGALRVNSDTQVAIDEAKRTLRHTRAFNSHELEIIQRMQEHLAPLITELYRAEMEDPELLFILDGINGVESTPWLNVLNYIRNKHLFAQRDVPTPRFHRHQLSYGVCCNFYDTLGQRSIITEILDAAVKHLKDNGGNKLFYDAEGLLADSVDIFTYSCHLVIASDSDSIEANADLIESQKTKALLLRAAWEDIPDFIRGQWAELHNPENSPFPDELPDDVIDAIAARVFAEFYSQEVKWFSILRSAHREIFRGVVDVPKGIFNLGIGTLKALWNPNKTATQVTGLLKDAVYLPYDLYCENDNAFVTGASGLMRGAYHHPLRMATSTVVSAAACSALLKSPGPITSPPGGGGAAATATGDVSSRAVLANMNSMFAADQALAAVGEGAAIAETTAFTATATMAPTVASTSYGPNAPHLFSESANNAGVDEENDQILDFDAGIEAMMKAITEAQIRSTGFEFDAVSSGPRYG